MGLNVNELTTQSTYMEPALVERSMLLSYALVLGGFMGLAGLHRFYLGRTASGLLWMFTFGFCGIGTIIDLVMLPRMVDDRNRGALGW